MRPINEYILNSNILMLAAWTAFMTENYVYGVIALIFSVYLYSKKCK